MERKKARWRNGCQVRGLDAEEVLEYFKRLETQTGEVNPRQVLTEAEDPKHFLHRYFDWNDTTAAEKHRLQQAAHLIRSVQVEVVRQQETREPIRAIVSIRRDGNRLYQTAERAWSEPHGRAQIVQQALNELQRWQAKYAHLHELRQIFESIGQQGQTG